MKIDDYIILRKRHSFVMYIYGVCSGAIKVRFAARASVHVS